LSTFAITTAYTSKNGAHYTPMVGEWYTLTVEYDVTGSPKNPYTVGFTMADKYDYYTQTDLTPGHKKVSKSFFLALDDEIPWQVDVDEFHLADADDPTKSKIPLDLPFGPVNDGRRFVAVRKFDWASARVKLMARQSLKGKFTPVPASKGIEFYDPRWLIATQGSFTQFGSGKIDRLAIMVGSPTTDSWQKALKVVCRATWGGGNDLLASRAVEGATMYPVFFFDKHNVPNAQFSIICQSVLEVQNQRVDASLLRAVTWQQLDALQGIDVFKTYTSPEAVIESKHSKITNFVTQTLGANHRNHMTPYDAARKLFKAVLKHCVYFYPQPGGPDKRATTAVQMVDTGIGDCGSFSLLLVALYRNIGFAARTACGAWKGQDAGHCWSEQYFPGHGFMISDGSIGNGQCEDGSYAYYFGSVPDLNARYADMRGNTFNIGDVQAQWLQGPYGPLVWGSAAPTVDAHTAVLEVSEADAMSLVNSGQQSHVMSGDYEEQINASSLAFQLCPCHKHGGYRSVTRNAIKGLAHVAAQRLG
jgi:hypothetical protein